MKRVIVFAISWLAVGIGLVLTGIPQSLANGWKTALYIVLFGPPIWILVETVLDGVGEVLQKVFVPKSIDSWHPVLRVAFFVIYTVTILLVIAAALHFLPGLLYENLR